MENLEVVCKMWEEKFNFKLSVLLMLSDNVSYRKVKKESKSCYYENI